ncbi:hypothetical protein EDD21DRAFT_291766, partial [Dissophora ornata]
CHNCGVTKTPLWRRTHDRLHSLCNACGLYYKQYKSNRPLHHQRENDAASDTEDVGAKDTAKGSDTTMGSSQSKGKNNSGTIIECANCGQTQTPLWRKDAKGQSICNACGLYARLHQRDRPITMRKSKITRRKR